MVRKLETFDVEEFGRTVFALLTKHAITSKFVCDEYGITRSTFSRVMNGQTGPDVQNYLRIKAFIDEWIDKEPSTPEGRYVAALEREVGSGVVARLKRDILSPTLKEPKP